MLRRLTCEKPTAALRHAVRSGGTEAGVLAALAAMARAGGAAREHDGQGAHPRTGGGSHGRRPDGTDMHNSQKGEGERPHDRQAAAAGMRRLHFRSAGRREQKPARRGLYYNFMRTLVSETTIGHVRHPLVSKIGESTAQRDVHTWDCHGSQRSDGGKTHTRSQSVGVQCAIPIPTASVGCIAACQGFGAQTVPVAPDWPEVRRVGLDSAPGEAETSDPWIARLDREVPRLAAV